MQKRGKRRSSFSKYFRLDTESRAIAGEESSGAFEFRGRGMIYVPALKFAGRTPAKPEKQASLKRDVIQKEDEIPVLCATAKGVVG